MSPRWHRVSLSATGLLLVGFCSCATFEEASSGHAAHHHRPSHGAGYSVVSPGGHPPTVHVAHGMAPSATQPGGQWIPPGIKGPWPADEYLSDGGDRGLPARPGIPGEILDLDTQDTVAVFDDMTGQTHVVPSNEVDIYAPRFGAVRSISTLSGYKTTSGTDQLGTMAGPEQVARLNGPESFAEDTTVAGVQTSLRASNYEADLTAGEVAKETVLEGVVGTQLASEQPGLLESASISQEQGVKQTHGKRQSITWSHEKSAQAVVDATGGNEMVAPSGAQETVTYGKPGGPPGTIQIEKRASSQTANPGDVLEFTIRYRNGGTTTVEKLSLIDHLTPRFEYLPETESNTLPSLFVATDEGGSTILRWDVGMSLKPGEGGVVKFQVRVR